MIDNRFPWLHRVEHAPGVGAVDRKRLTQSARSIANKVGCNVLYNARSGELYFYYGRDPQVGAWGEPVLRRDGTIKLPDEDFVAKTLALGKVSPFVKARWLKQHEQRKQWAQSEAMEIQLEDSRHERLDRARRVLNGRVTELAGCPVPTARSNRKETAA